MRQWSPDGSLVRPHPASGHGPIPWPSPDLIADGLRGLTGDVVGTSDLHPDAHHGDVFLSLPMAFESAVGMAFPCWPQPAGTRLDYPSLWVERQLAPGRGMPWQRCAC
jgi:hypothetical protein